MNHDELLEKALSTYSSHEPLAGLEQRILQRVHSARPRRWKLPAVILVAASLVLTFALWRKPPQQPAVKRASAALPAPARPTTVQPVPRAALHRHRKHAPPRAFPTPRPLSAQERALLAFVEKAPKEALIIKKHDPAIEPIRMAEIKIEPLTIASLQ